MKFSLVGLCEKARWQRDLKRRLEEEGVGGRDVNNFTGARFEGTGLCEERLVNDLETDPEV
jgi:hypothetical protein